VFYEYKFIIFTCVLRGGVAELLERKKEANGGMVNRVGFEEFSG
jgi:hypothetical protein